MTIWTADEDKTLSNMWDKGEPASVIARVVGRTKNSVISRAHRLKLASRPNPLTHDYGKKISDGWARRPRQTVIRLKPKPKLGPVGSLEALSPQSALNGVGVSHSELRPSMCQFPVTLDSPFRFCGCHPLTGKPYCSAHSVIAYTNFREAEDMDFHAGSKAA